MIIKSEGHKLQKLGFQITLDHVRKKAAQKLALLPHNPLKYPTCLVGIPLPS